MAEPAARPPERVPKIPRRRLGRVLASRRIWQWAMAVLVILIGLQFTFWLRPQLYGHRPVLSRPPGVEGFLPINSMLGLRLWLTTGVIDPIHPAGLAIFVGILLMSLVVARSFCSHLCPVGLVSELLGRLGGRLLGRTFEPPAWVDLPLRAIKWLLLGFFAWAVWVVMSPESVALFLTSPYAAVADVKMWLFFADPSRLTVAVLLGLVLLSIAVRDFWCRYLCPYGALLGLVGRLAPFKVARDAAACTDCGACTSVCPARLPVHRLTVVSSVECTSCQDCVVACQTPSSLQMRVVVPGLKRRALRPAWVAALAGLVFLGVVLGFRLSGHWRGRTSDEEYRRRIKEIRSPIYDHFGARPAPPGGPRPA